MATNPLIYVRKGEGAWHIARPGAAPDVTLCGLHPSDRWDDQTVERPGSLCPVCEKAGIDYYRLPRS